MADIIRKKERKNWFYSYNMIFDQPISEHAKIVFLYLCRCADSEGQSFPSYKKIGSQCSIKSRQTVLNAIKELESIGLLTRESRKNKDGGQTSNLYTIYDTPVQQMDTPCPADGHPPVQQMDTPCPPDGHEGLPSEGLPIINNNNNDPKGTTGEKKEDTEEVTTDFVVVVKELKQKIYKVVGKISDDQLIHLINKVGIDKINEYIEKYPEFEKVQEILNPVGFFISAILGEWSVPVSSKPNKTNNFNSFEQHDYNENDLEHLFEPIG